MADINFNSEHQEPEIKSKTQLKQESQALQKLGESLVSLSSASLAKIPLDDELADAIALARKIDKKKEGHRRQLQLVGKLMRSRDVAPIQSALEHLQMAHLQTTKSFHKIEDARDKVLTGHDATINSLLNEYPELDRQKLRQFARLAKKQREENKPPKASRELFQYLKENLPD